MSEELNEKQKQLKERFARERGYWSEEVMGPILRLGPTFLKLT